ncbi:MAG: TetR/AcrR family transcriptional regulator [Deltaproteobacteria bacterium]|nr:TetR/AcrR family transcriptional regulator [Deltaproteobacteria bacterium]
MKAPREPARRKKPAAGPKLPTERPGQPGGRRDTNRRERTKALSDAALALFLARGIEAVTIEDITTKAGVAKGSFYRYFDDKTALVESLFAPVQQEVAAAFDGSVQRLREARTREEAFSSYEQIGEGLGRVILHHGDVVQLYLQECRAPAEGARAPARRLAGIIADKAIEHTRLARDHGLLRSVPAEVSTLTVIGAAERILFAVLNGEFRGEPLEVPGQLITLILDGLRAPDLVRGD